MLNVDHVTLYRWVIRYAPHIEKPLRWHRRLCQALSWQVDETYSESILKSDKK